MKYFQIIFLVQLLFFASCANKKGHSSGDSIESVNFEQKSSSKERPHIRNELVQRGIGPSPITETNYSEQKAQKNPVISLNLGPGLNRAIGHISLLKSFETNKIPVHIITGSGMGALIAALYSTGVTPEMMEWKFYKFFAETKEIEAFSPKWIHYLKKIFLNDLQGKSIQSSRITLIVPIYDQMSNKVFYLTRGDLHKHVLSNFILYNSERYMTPILKKVFQEKELIRRGADIIISIDALSDNIYFERGNDYLIGTYGKVAGVIKNEKEFLKLFFELPSSDIPLDSQTNLPLYMKKSLKKSNEIAQAVIGVIKAWPMMKLSP